MNRFSIAMCVIFLIGCAENFAPKGGDPKPGGNAEVGSDDFAEKLARYVETDLPETTDQFCKVAETAAKIDGVAFDASKILPEFAAENKPLDDASRKAIAEKLRGRK